MASVSTAATPMTRRRLSTEERRAAILAAALEAFAGSSYADVSAARVAEASGSSTGLVFHYFGSKAQLYADVVRGGLQDLAQAQAKAQAELPEGVPVRDRVRAAVLVRLDHAAGRPGGRVLALVGGEEPPEALAVRREARAAEVESLRALLPLTRWARHEYALWGWFGFLDQVCLRWSETGCPEDQRHPLADAALGALEGALGDWGG